MARDPARGSVSRCSDIRQLEEEEQTLESRLEEISAQLEGDGFTSVSQMRSVLTPVTAAPRKTFAMSSSFFRHGLPGVRCGGCSRRIEP